MFNFQMLDPSVLTELEELILCGNCKQKYNDNEQCPKYLSCKHYFCLRCIENNFIKGRELLCAHCWKKTELNEQGADGLQTNLPLLALANNFSCLKITNNKTNFIKSTDKERKSENCLTHGMPLALWCATCCTQLCRACATPQDHPGHQVRTVLDAKEQLISDVQVELATMGKLSSEIQRLAVQQREFLIKILEACVTLKTHVETDLQNGWSHLPEIQDARETLGKAKANLQIIDNPSDVMSLYSQLLIEKHRLQSKYHEMMLQCQLDDLIGNSGVLFNFDLLKQAVAGVQNGDTTILPQLHQQNGRLNNLSTNPILFLANYCMSQLYSRHVISKQSTTTTTVNNISQQNGTIDYHHQQQHQVPTAPPQSNGTIHLNSIALSQHQFQPTSPNQQQQLILLPPNSPSIKSSSLTSINSLLQQQQQQQHNSYLQDSSSSGSSSNTGGGLLVGINSPTTINNNNILLRGPGNNIYPMYYFNIDVNGSSYGRIVIEVRPDVAPKMSQNFSVLSSGDIGIGYKGCAIFQCWEGESIITGDFELNNGRGGRSIFDDGYFMPDDTKFPAVRGAVGMRRTQKRHDNMGMVGSQFRIILQEMRGFTGIFGHVVEGLELVEKLSTYGDQTGKPTKNILITQCGKL